MAKVFKSKYFIRNNARVAARKTVSRALTEGKKFFASFIAIIVLFGSLFYVFQINGLATKGYEVGEYEKELANLKNENQKLIIKLAEIRSVNNFESGVDKFTEVSSSDISYISSSSGAVAMRK